MNKNTANKNVESRTQQQTQPSSIVLEDFGDVNQYRELNAIGTGERNIFIVFCEIFL